ncbi:hypothetical protein SMMN14_08986 [Sphaerulina musiva]
MTCCQPPRHRPPSRRVRLTESVPYKRSPADLAVALTAWCHSIAEHPKQTWRPTVLSLLLCSSRITGLTLRHLHSIGGLGMLG